MSKNIVLFYSRTGNSKKAAKQLAKLLDCETAEIVSKKTFSGFLGWFSAGRSALAGKEVEITEPDIKPEDYETVIICAPIWAGRLASPAKMWLIKNAQACKNIAFLFTSGSGDSSGTMKDTQAITKKENNYENLSNSDKKSGKWADKIKDFSQKL